MSPPLLRDVKEGATEVKVGRTSDTLGRMGLEASFQELMERL
jgi:hypothetical protein